MWSSCTCKALALRPGPVGMLPVPNLTQLRVEDPASVTDTDIVKARILHVTVDRGHTGGSEPKVAEGCGWLHPQRHSRPSPGRGNGTEPLAADIIMAACCADWEYCSRSATVGSPAICRYQFTRCTTLSRKGWLVVPASQSATLPVNPGSGCSRSNSAR